MIMIMIIVIIGTVLSLVSLLSPTMLFADNVHADSLQLEGVHEENRRERGVGSYPENSIVGGQQRY